MARREAVTDTSPVIALVGIGAIHLLDELFEAIVVPFAVWEELSAKPGAPEPDLLRALRGIAFLPSPTPQVETSQLDPGERAAIALTVARPGSCLLLDERAACGVAKGLGLDVIGTLGVLVEARRRALVPALGPLLEQMERNGFRLSPTIIRAVLASVGEGP